MMPTIGISQSPDQEQPHGDTNASISSHLQVVSLEPGRPRETTNNSVLYIKLWKGTLELPLPGILAGQRVHLPICQLEGYGKTSSHDTLAADWPATIQIKRVIPMQCMLQKDYRDKAKFLMFRTHTRHDLLVQLAEKKLCTVIQLPCQTLLLAGADKPSRMIGMLLPGEILHILHSQLSSRHLTASATAPSQTVIANNFLRKQQQDPAPNQSPDKVQAVSNTVISSLKQYVPLESGGLHKTANNSVKYTRLWEGILAGKIKGSEAPIPICKLEGYRQTLVPDTLAADWPATMQIMRLLPVTTVIQTYTSYCEMDDCSEGNVIVFQIRTPHAFLLQLAEKKLCAVIQLPSQTLLLASTENTSRLLGLLYQGEISLPPIPSEAVSTND